MIMGCFCSSMGYFGVEWPVLGYLALQERGRAHAWTSKMPKTKRTLYCLYSIWGYGAIIFGHCGGPDTWKRRWLAVFRLHPVNYELVLGIAAFSFGLLGFPGRSYVASLATGALRR